MSFTRDGHLLSTSDKGILRRWPLSVATGEDVQTLWSRLDAGIGLSLEVDPGGRFVVVSQRGAGRALVVPLDGSKPVSYQLRARPGTTIGAHGYTLDPSGRFLAMAIGSLGHPDQTAIRILDLATGDERTLDTQPKGEQRCEEVGSVNEGVAIPVWLPDGRLVSDPPLAPLAKSVRLETEEGWGGGFESYFISNF